MDRKGAVLLKIISRAIAISSKAGAEIRRITKTGELGIVDKGVRDYQTAADRNVQRMIVVSLAKHFPECKIVGEEDLIADKKADENLVVDDFDETILTKKLPSEYENIEERDLIIWVDPLDGTTEFVKGQLEHVTVLIGISLNNRSIAGIIQQPFYGYSKLASKQDFLNLSGRTMWAILGLGTFGFEPKLLTNETNNNNLIVTTSASHGNANVEQSLEALSPSQIIKVGGAGNKVLMILEGKAHSYIFSTNGCKRWDTSAPEVLLKAAGGKLTDSLGNDIEYAFREDGKYNNYLGVVASASESIHKKVIETIPNEVKERLTGDYKKTTSRL